MEFPKVLKTLTGLIGADEPLEDDVEDLFTLLDINGDENINRQEFGSLLWTFFQILEK
jgi:Ca2+-binding EF-hand superfamily protein